MTVAWITGWRTATSVSVWAVWSHSQHSRRIVRNIQCSIRCPRPDTWPQGSQCEYSLFVCVCVSSFIMWLYSRPRRHMERAVTGTIEEEEALSFFLCVFVVVSSRCVSEWSHATVCLASFLLKGTLKETYDNRDAILFWSYGKPPQKRRHIPAYE